MHLFPPRLSDRLVMHVGFFYELKRAGVPVSLKEFLLLLEAVQRRVPGYDVERYYHLARATLVKDERHLDRFDRVFAKWFEGAADIGDPFREIPEEWLRFMGERYLTEEEKRAIEAMGGWDELMETLRKRLAEQKGRHQGGSKWIGTGGTSPFGAWGYNPAGVRIGQDGSRHRRAVKVWDRREFRDFDDQVELGTRTMKLALRKLRRLTRSGRDSELDLPGTVKSTAANAGWLDLRTHPSRANSMKVLLLLDAGGSMDDHVQIVEQLFSAARAEFKNLEHLYFHNCLYERVWKDNHRRHRETTPTMEMLRTWPRDTRLVFVGDASMSPWEIAHAGGSVEHWNEEPGVVWMRRALDHFERAVWINPIPFEFWDWTHSIGMMREIMGGRMAPLTLGGIEEAVGWLKA